MHVTDRQTDRITTPKTALAHARVVKTNCSNTNEFQIQRVAKHHQSDLLARMAEAICCISNIQGWTVTYLTREDDDDDDDEIAYFTVH